MLRVLALTLLAAAAADALARHSVPTAARVEPLSPVFGPLSQRLALGDAREYLLPRFLLPHFLGYDESPRMPPPRQTAPNHDWLNKEIERINQMEDEEEPVRPYDDDLADWIARDPYLQRMFENSVKTGNRHKIDPDNLPEEGRPMPHSRHSPVITMPAENKRPAKKEAGLSNAERKIFALTPLDKGYFEPELNAESHQGETMSDITNTGDGAKAALILEPPRQTRQNPNLSRTKTLLTENIEKLRSGLANKDYRLPVSLLPTNLRWLKINHPVEDEESETYEEGGGSRGDRGDRSPAQVPVLSAAGDPVHPLFFAALCGSIAAGVFLIAFGIVLMWVILTKKSKDAADVDYPAYGVTGPTVDSSGDRKLAHSAHMYHYQHQKQQIIAMESRMDLEQRLGSVSDPESEENEEGDYTVYECPGFATTGDMEVKNPLFSDDPTPVTPGSCEVVKPQPTTNST